MQAVVAILAALLARERTGRGRWLDVAAADGVLALMSQQIDEYLAIGTLPGPGSNILTGRFACYDCYPTRDGRWISVGAIEPHFYANLCKALGLERFIPYQEDDARQDEIRAAFRAAFLTGTRDEWVARLAPADCCVAPVNTVPELCADPHFAARSAWTEAEDSAHGRFRQLAPMLAGGVREQPLHRVRPGTDTDLVLAAAGFGAGEIRALREAGAVE
jgi:alpha-methylacyl-CoA racemase